MSFTRIAAYASAVVLVAFVLIVLLYGQYAGGNWIVVGLVMVGLVAVGSKLYGRQSRYGAIVERKRPAQEAHNRAADVAADARRAAAEAARRGDRYCPLDPANDAAHASTNGNGHASTNGHAAAPQAAPPPPPHPN